MTNELYACYHFNKPWSTLHCSRCGQRPWIQTLRLNAGPSRKVPRIIRCSITCTGCGQSITRLNISRAVRAWRVRNCLSATPFSKLVFSVLSAHHRRKLTQLERFYQVESASTKPCPPPAQGELFPDSEDGTGNTTPPIPVNTISTPEPNKPIDQSPNTCI